MAKEKISGVYKIENLVNGKVYIGQSKNIYKRWSDHKYYLKNNLHQNIYLQRAWNKYGMGNFLFEILYKTLQEEDLNIKESYYINLFKSNDYKYGYNCTSGGEKYTITETSKKNRMLAQENNKPILQIDFDGNIVNRWYGVDNIQKTLLVNTRNIRECCNNANHRKTALGFIWIYEYNYNAESFNLEDYTIKDKNNKEINQYDLEGNFIATYESAREAERVTGVGYKMISRVCKGERPYTHGYIWKFAS